MNNSINLNSLRAKQARIAKTIGKTGYDLLIFFGLLFLVVGILLALRYNVHYLFILIAPSLVAFLPALWWKHYLSLLPPSGESIEDRLSKDILARLKPGRLSPKLVWQDLSNHWQAIFFINHLMLNIGAVTDCLSGDEKDLGAALTIANQLALENNSPLIEPCFFIAGLALSSPKMSQLLSSLKIQPADVKNVTGWVGRNLPHQVKKQSFGGIGRDFAFGFTPLLDHLGLNITRGVIAHKAHFDSLMKSEGVSAIEAAFANHGVAIALVGPNGIGKTESVYALAEKLISGQTKSQLAYRQIISINATDIISRASQPGDLEDVMLRLVNEASHAGNVILFLDDAQLFLNNAPGSFDASQILLTIIQTGAIRIILAMEPNDFQRLKSANAGLANLLTPIVLSEPDEAGVMSVLEDNSLGIEYQNKVLIAYDALKEAYRLSGRYNQEEAYPGKAIKLLSLAISHAHNSIVTAASVQSAVEQTYGVKASNAAPLEASMLLNLEEDIHRRMINQDQAVSVVANALRRARAGITNHKRPIGSFLFLGPTGVGKTELAKAVADTYFGSVNSLIRLDMSEYSAEDDSKRFLASGKSEKSSLLMSIHRQPFSVVLLDEIEKAHPAILNLLLQLLDEGQLTDVNGRAASFKDCIIIATSNASAQTIRQLVARGDNLEQYSSQLTDQLISSGQFKPELLNRFDEIVYFRPLTLDELARVVALLVDEVNLSLANQNISIELTEAAIKKIVEEGNDPRLGARPMRRVLQRTVENSVAKKILRGEVQPGSRITLNDSDLETG